MREIGSFRARTKRFQAHDFEELRASKGEREQPARFALGAEGRGFESLRPDHSKKELNQRLLFLGGLLWSNT